MDRKMLENIAKWYRVLTRVLKYIIYSHEIFKIFKYFEATR